MKKASVAAIVAICIVLFGALVGVAIRPDYVSGTKPDYTAEAIGDK